MKPPRITKRRTLITIIVCLLVIMLLVLITLAWRNKPNSTSTQTSRNSTPSHEIKTDPTVESAQTGETSAPVSDTAACRQFTLGLAQAILGDGAKNDIGASITVSDTTDSTESTCVYSSDAGNVRLRAYHAKTPLGESNNTVAFGSGRPQGVEMIQGHGQAAYWNEQEHELSVLKNNDRYVISRSQGNPPFQTGKDEVLQAANVIVPKL